MIDKSQADKLGVELKEIQRAWGFINLYYNPNIDRGNS